MPDEYGFTHEPHWGAVYHRCIDCDAYPWGLFVPERDRKRHRATHAREEARALQKVRSEALRRARLARKLKREAHQ